MKLTTRRIAFAGVLAAAYATLTIVEGLLLPTLAYGTVQFRFAEALSVLCCFTPYAIVGMVLGCVIANLFSTVGALDIVVGSLATLLACVVTWAMGRAALKKTWVCALVPLPTVLFNALIVGALIAFFTPGSAFLPAWGLNALTVGAGEAAVMYALGLPLLLWLRANKRLSRQLREI